jgi:hypothetical protein
LPTNSFAKSQAHLKPASMGLMLGADLVAVERHARLEAEGLSRAARPMGAVSMPSRFAPFGEEKLPDIEGAAAGKKSSPPSSPV